MEVRPTPETTDLSTTKDNIAPVPNSSGDNDHTSTLKEPAHSTVEGQEHTSQSSSGDNHSSALDECEITVKQRSPKARTLSKRTPKKWTLEHLLHNPNSELTKCISLRERIDFQLLNLLPQDDLDELCKLLPPADVNFIKYQENEDHATEVVAESMEEYEAMATQPDKYFPIISSRFMSPEFTRTVEDFQILLSNGYYELETPKQEEPKRTAGRKRSNIEDEEDEFKDENYEAYWGERMKKHRKKRGRR